MKKSHALATGFHAHMSSVREVCYERNVYSFYWCACVVGILLRERERGFGGSQIGTWLSKGS